jgi:AraC-like DNA-binding protein
MKKNREESKLLFRNDTSTPLGRLSLAGILTKRERTGFSSMRVLGSYAVVFLYDGSGIYQDANGVACELAAGDLILLFPEIAHRYGPRHGEAWSEIYVVFDGPAFDLWRDKGVLTSDRPVLHLEAIEEWRVRLESTLTRATNPSPRQALQQVATFLNLLTEICSLQLPGDASYNEITHEEKWLAIARRSLEENLSASLDMREVARQSGLSYESFRKRFAKEVGVAPSRYRMERRIAAAQTLLTQSNLTLRAVAMNLGFSDEFHFSRRFKQITGQTPNGFRRKGKVNFEPRRRGGAESF